MFGEGTGHKRYVRDDDGGKCNDDHVFEKEENPISEESSEKKSNDLFEEYPDVKKEIRRRRQIGDYCRYFHSGNVRLDVYENVFFDIRFVFSKRFERSAKDPLSRNRANDSGGGAVDIRADALT